MLAKTIALPCPYCNGPVVSNGTVECKKCHFRWEDTHERALYNFHVTCLEITQEELAKHMEVVDSSTPLALHKHIARTWMLISKIMNIMDAQIKLLGEILSCEK